MAWTSPQSQVSSASRKGIAGTGWKPPSRRSRTLTSQEDRPSARTRTREQINAKESANSCYSRIIRACVCVLAAMSWEAEVAHH